MNTHPIRSTLVCALGVALALASGSAWAISFRITDLGTLGGSFCSCAAMNASGQVTGGGFMWDGTTLHDLGTLGGSGGTSGTAINDSGQVTGSSLTAGNAAQHAFLWDGTTMVDLGTLGDDETSRGQAINASGQVTGRSYTEDDFGNGGVTGGG